MGFADSACVPNSGTLIFHGTPNGKEKMKVSQNNTKKRGSLHSSALRLAKTVTLEELHALTSLPLAWLRKFKAEEIANPSVNRVQHVYEKLSGKSLSL